MTARKTRTPRVSTRDPKPRQREEPQPKQTRKPRHFIPASAPTVCPDCGHNTRMDNGRHVDPVRKTILEYRTCVKCEKKLAAGRDMTPREAETLCDRAPAVAEYEETVAG